MRIDQAKRAISEAIKKGGGYECAAEWMGCSKATLHNLQNINMSDDPRDRELGWLMKLDEFAGAPVFLSAMAAAQGYVLTAVDGASDQDFKDAVLRFTGAAGALAGGAVKALEDGKIDQREERDLRQLIKDAGENVHHIQRSLEEKTKRRGRG